MAQDIIASDLSEHPVIPVIHRPKLGGGRLIHGEARNSTKPQHPQKWGVGVGGGRLLGASNMVRMCTLQGPESYSLNCGVA